MEKSSIFLPPWRIGILRRLDVVLILFELVLSAIFVSLSYLTANLYVRGVGVGLVIAWVTSAIAYLFKKKMAEQ
ncbi:MAG: hypothetical protein WB778_06105 [Thermoplasmata archaeon]|jgi:hypothetical protein